MNVIEKLNAGIANEVVFIQSYSGRSITFLDPKEDQIDVEDIAHALSLLCRFGGHCREFYSVAEHSVRCSVAAFDKGLSDRLQFEALLHDASEAYLVDMPRPIKQQLQGYRDIEGRLDTVIRGRFGLPLKMSEEIHLIDNEMLATEKRDLMQPSDNPWSFLPDPYEGKIHPMSPKEAFNWFMEKFEELI